MRKKLEEVKEEVENNIFHRFDSLITGWLNEQPKQDIDEYWLQVEKARWRETRYFNMMQKCFWGNEDEII